MRDGSHGSGESTACAVVPPASRRAGFGRQDDAGGPRVELLPAKRLDALYQHFDRAPPDALQRVGCGGHVQPACHQDRVAADDEDIVGACEIRARSAPRSRRAQSHRRHAVRNVRDMTVTERDQLALHLMGPSSSNSKFTASNTGPSGHAVHRRARRPCYSAPLRARGVPPVPALLCPIRRRNRLQRHRRRHPAVATPRP